MVKSRYLVEFPAQKKEPKWFQNLGRFKKNASCSVAKQSPKNWTGRCLSLNMVRRKRFILGTNTARALQVPVRQCEETDSTDVKYKIRQWSLPGPTIVPVLNVSCRVFWLELDDKALLDSYAVLQEGILCDVFSQKCSAAWQGARGERLTVAIMLPGRQDADDWLNFMLSQKNLWPTFTARGTLTKEISEQVFSKERRRLQAKHLWMVVKLR